MASTAPEVASVSDRECICSRRSGIQDSFEHAAQCLQKCITGSCAHDCLFNFASVSWPEFCDGHAHCFVRNVQVSGSL